MARVAAGPIAVVAHGIPVNDVIGTRNWWISLVPRSLLIKTHVGAVTSKTRAIFWCLILANHVIGLGNSLSVHIGRLSKDGTIFELIPKVG